MSFAVRPLFKNTPPITRQPVTGEYNYIANPGYYWYIDQSGNIAIWWDNVLLNMEAIPNNTEITTRDFGDGWIYYRGAETSFDGGSITYGLYRILK